jgi:hypothetical protein
MKKRTLLLLLLVACLLSSGAAAAQTDRLGAELTYWVEGTASGGRYHLTGARWQFSGIASANGYHLIPQSPQAAFAGGCCCTYLPCVIRRR